MTCCISKFLPSPNVKRLNTTTTAGELSPLHGTGIWIMTLAEFIGSMKPTPEPGLFCHLTGLEMAAAAWYEVVAVCGALGGAMQEIATGFRVPSPYRMSFESC